MLLKDKVVIISGIGPGLGTELALEAARQGAKLIVAARTQKNLDKAEAKIKEINSETEVLKVTCDISDRDQCKNLVKAGIDKYSRIDSLINSAFSPGTFEPIEKANLDGWRTAMDVNFFGSMNLSLECIPYIKEQGGGSIVMINTMVSRKPMPTQAGYGASKSALLSATQHMALELGQHNIRVNSAFMGWMWGASVKGYFDFMESTGSTTAAAEKEKVEKNIPLGLMPTDEDCANSAIFLASDYAKAVTGACLDVNGGEYLSH